MSVRGAHLGLTGKGLSVPTNMFGAAIVDNSDLTAEGTVQQVRVSVRGSHFLRDFDSESGTRNHV